jgi:hypothetical protein
VRDINEHIIAGSLSINESAYPGRHNQLAKIIHQQTVVQYTLLDVNTLPYYRHKPEPVLESVIMILYWDKSIITDKMVDFNKPEIVPNNRQ